MIDIIRAMLVLVPLKTTMSFIKSSWFVFQLENFADNWISPIEFTTCFAAYLPSRAWNWDPYLRINLPLNFVFPVASFPSKTACLLHLQTLNDHNLLIPLESLPRIFTASHRQSLGLEVDHHSIAGIKDETLARFLELVDVGFNLVTRYERGSWLMINIIRTRTSGKQKHPTWGNQRNTQSDGPRQRFLQRNISKVQRRENGCLLG